MNRNIPYKTSHTHSQLPRTRYFQNYTLIMLNQDNLGYSFFKKRKEVVYA